MKVISYRHSGVIRRRLHCEFCEWERRYFYRTLIAALFIPNLEQHAQSAAGRTAVGRVIVVLLHRVRAIAVALRARFFDDTPDTEHFLGCDGGENRDLRSGLLMRPPYIRIVAGLRQPVFVRLAMIRQGLARDDQRPGLRVLFMSGYSEEVAKIGDFDGGRASLLSKPFTPDVLARKVREVLGRT